MAAADGAVSYEPLLTKILGGVDPNFLDVRWPAGAGLGVEIDEALAAGALHYLTKPLNLSTFLSAIDQALEDIDTQFDDLPDA